jgi:putative holliday junction resolvase
MSEDLGVIAALDVGEVRIGIAMNPPGVSIAQPLMTIGNDAKVIETIASLIRDNNVTQLVVGNPRNMQGNDTKQTRYVEGFVEKLKSNIDIPIHMQDEALTSVKAEEELKDRKSSYEKGDIDSLAATYILQDYIEENVRVQHA